MHKIGLLFGSFNPLHNGHIMVAKAAQEDNNLDEVWFVVQPKNIYKPTFDLLDYETRKKLISNSGYTVYQSKSTNYAHFILETLKEVTDADATLILGEDLSAGFKKWPDYDQIRDLASIYQSHRIDGISSGQVRDRLKHNQPIDDLVPPAVANYLKKHLHSN